MGRKKWIHVDETGNRYGSLLVLGSAGRTERGPMWNVQCDCGASSVLDTYRLHAQPGKRKVCWACRGLTHGKSHLPEYEIWRSMRQRCSNPKNADYPLYGGRGISVCESWDTSFDSFYSDMGPQPAPRHSVDRIDGNGNYEPGNCKWASQLEQMSHTSKSRMIEYQGRTMHISAWAREINMNLRTLRNRLDRSGWSVEKALTTPLGRWTDRP